MATFAIPSPDELRDRALRGLNAELPELRTGEGTLPRAEVSTYARITADNHIRISQLDLDATPDTATEAGLERWAIVLGVARKSATGARKADALEIRGTNGSVVPVDTQLTHGSGLVYKVTAAVTIPAAGVTTADIEAVSTGASTRLNAGEALRFTTPPAGIELAARLVLNLDEGGDDIEPIGAWRARVVQKFRDGSNGGRVSDYEANTLAASDAVRSAYPYANKPSARIVSIAALKDGTGTARVLSAAERDAIDEYLTDPSRKPITDEIVVMTTPTQVVHVDVRISVLDSAAFDWDDSAGYTVTSWNATTRELVISPSLPGELAVGHLVTIKSASPGTSGSDGYPAQVSALIPPATCVLAPYGGRAQPLSWTPSPGDNVYASSVTALKVRTNILDGYEVGDAFTDGLNTLGPANPDHAYGDWESDVIKAKLQAAAFVVPGVSNASVAAPAFDVSAEEFAFPDDDQVELLIPGEVVVRTL
jgi:uncharacterized phage protein gp47/JayE